jgi:hypothetical protein
MHHSSPEVGMRSNDALGQYHCVRTPTVEPAEVLVGEL